jgi:uncharacterized protein
MPIETLISAHPIDENMRVQVLENLRQIEINHQVKVLFACESGSRGWGFASPDSDYDVRFIYVNRLPWYLAVEPHRDVIEQPISGDLDINGWDLRKALQLLRRSNPILLEWLHSPIVYQEEATTVSALRHLAETDFSNVRGYHHYLSMAKRNFREHLRGEEVRYKKYLYVLRPLLAARWIRENSGVPPMRFAALAQKTLNDPVLLSEINQLLEIKMRAGEAATSPRWLAIHDFIERELKAAAAHVVLPHDQPKTQALDQFLFETILKHDYA